jgi:large subunit ribosomal protein L6
MSRIGKQPIPVPDGVDVAVGDGRIKVKGKNGEMEFEHHPNMSVVYDGEKREIQVSRPDDERLNRSLHGLTRSLINNMVRGATEYFEKRLEIVGVGYQAIDDGKNLALSVGFANVVRLLIPQNVICELVDATHVVVKSMSKQAVGQFAADIRAVRPPEPYKGKGIRYQGEQVKRKAGKAFGAGAG